MFEITAFPPSVVCALWFQITVTMIPAHNSPLAALTFNASATKLASASERVRRTLHLDSWQGSYGLLFGFS